MDEQTNTLIDELADGVVIDEPTQDEQQEQEQTESVTDDVIIAALNSPSEGVKAALQQIVNDAVKKVLAKNTPKRTPVKADPITKEQFEGMSYEEREALYNSNRPLYDKLKNY